MRVLRTMLIASSVALGAAAPAPSYHVAGRIAGPDGGGWDYARVDPERRRLYIAHGDAVTMIDLTPGGTASSIGAVSRGHAVLPVPNSSVLLVTSGNDDSVRLLDAASGRETAKIAVGKKPDAAIWDPASKRALVMNADDGSISVIDVGAAKVDRTIRVKPALEYAAIGPGGTLFVNDEDANELETVDMRAGKAGPAIPLKGCDGPTGLAYDESSRRLIAACANGKAAVVDAHRRRLIGLVDIGRGADAVLLDAPRRLAFVPCGRDGLLDVLAIDAAGGVRKVQSVRTEAGARTGALDPTDGTIYLPTASFDAPPAAGGRPTARPGTFHVLVVKPD